MEEISSYLQYSSCEKIEKYFLVENSIKITVFVASINPCKNTISDTIMLVGYCPMKVLVRTYKIIVGHKRWL